MMLLLESQPRLKGGGEPNVGLVHFDYYPAWNGVTLHRSESMEATCRDNTRTLRATRFTQVEVTFRGPGSPGFASFDVLRSGREAGNGKRPPLECVNAVEPGPGRVWNIFPLLSVCYRRQANCPVEFLFPISKIRAIVALGSPKRPASAAGSEAGMDCGTAPAKRARLNPCGESLLRRMVARPRAPAPTAERRFGEKSGSNPPM